MSLHLVWYLVADSQIRPETTLDYALGVFLGLSVLGIVNGVIGGSPTVILSQPNFVKK